MLQIFSLAAIVLLTAADQLIKYFVDLYLKPIELHSFIPGFIRLNYVENTGAAFGSFANNTLILTVITVIVLAGLFLAIMLKKLPNPLTHWCLVLIVSGGIGNVIDRIFRGYVIDYLDFQFMKFAIFNFADCLVTVGAAIIIGYLIYDVVVDMKKPKSGEKNLTESEK